MDNAVTTDALRNRGKVKVLFITSDASAVAGVGPCLADFLEQLDRERFAAFIICPHTHGRQLTILPRLEKLELPLFRRHLGAWLPSPPTWGARHLLDFFGALKPRVWAIAKLIERESIDLVYSNGLPCIDGAIAALRTGRPHLWHLHEAVRDNADLRRYLPIRVIEETVARLSDAVIVNSAFLAGHFTAPRLQSKIRIVHNGIDLDRIAAVPDDLGQQIRQELAIPQASRIVLAVGTVAPRKGYDTLARAARQVLTHVPDAVFLIAGAQLADHTPRLTELITRLGLNEAFRLLGPRADIPSLLAAADVFAHGARQETFGRVLVEAMAAGKPVVATRSGGPEEIVVDGETGFLAPIDGHAPMADALVRLLRNPELARRMGEQGRLRAASRFSVQVYARHLTEVIESVLREQPMAKAKDQGPR